MTYQKRKHIFATLTLFKLYFPFKERVLIHETTIAYGRAPINVDIDIAKPSLDK